MTTTKIITARDYTGTIERRVPRLGIVEYIAIAADGTEQTAIRVPVANAGRLRERFDKLVRKANRLGFEPPVLTKVADLSVPKRNEADIIEWHRFGLYTLVAKPVHFNGWAFVAAIQHIATEDGYRNVVRTSPRFEGTAVDPIIRTSRPVCEHCNTARKRNDTYVIQHDDGSRKQVGRQCLKDYVGEATGAEILRSAQYERELGDFIDDDWGTGSGGAKAWDVRTVLAITLASVELRGWTSRGNAREYGYHATADHVLGTLTETKDEEQRRAWDQEGLSFVPPWGDAEREQADTIIEWTEAIADDTDSDYLWNLKVACSLGGIAYRELGIVCSAVAAYERHVKGERLRREREVAAKVSAAIGRAGDKIGRKLSAADKRKGAEAHAALTVTVSDTRLFDGEYGTSELVSMTDADGNVLKWFASGRANSDDGERVTVGSTYTLVATIKGHGEYRGVTETKVNRCVLTPAQ
jgi:hypothetical protein